MEQKPTLKEQQLAWAVAWQDHGDRAALTALCASVEGFVVNQARKFARTQDVFEELRAEYRLAVVEAAVKFDRSRPDGFVTLCGFYMQDAGRKVARHASSPATTPDKIVKKAQRVAIFGDDEGETGFQLWAPEAYSESASGWAAIEHAADVAG